MKGRWWLREIMMIGREREGRKRGDDMKSISGIGREEQEGRGERGKREEQRRKKS